jgi:hypothetical protein
MPDKGSDKGKAKSGSRRLSAKPHRLHPVPSGETKTESGPRRLYAPPGTIRSTSSKESGPRRLYTSPLIPGRHSVFGRVLPKT